MFVMALSFSVLKRFDVTFLKSLIHQFLLVISLIKVTESKFLNRKMSCYTKGGWGGEITPNITLEEGVLKSITYVLLEGEGGLRSVTCII